MDNSGQSSQPTVRLGIDFGTSTLVIALLGGDGCTCHTLRFPGWSQEMPGRGTGEPVYAVPVLIHYDENGGRTLGDEVIRAERGGDPATAQWIRNYLLDESAVRIPVTPDHHLTYRDAATDFLTAVVTRAVQECTPHTPLVFTIPPERPEWYDAWLGGIARAAGVRSWHTLSEPAATVGGYGLVPEEGQVYLILCWDETDFSVSCVQAGSESDRSPAGGLQVTGSAHDSTGCRVLDAWIVQDIAARRPVKYSGGKAQRIRDSITRRIGEIYDQLAGADEATMAIEDPLSRTTMPVRVSRGDISRILTEHKFGQILERTINRALGSARTRGSEEGTPVAILLTGRGCALPPVQDLVKKMYAGVSVLSGHPFDAAARGAALFLPAANHPDRIRNDYALRYWDPQGREHRYRFLVRSGARYPSAGQVARVTVSAAYDGQTRLGIPLYEIRAGPDADGPALELVADEDGGVRLAGPLTDAGDERKPVPANGTTPILLPANPPGLKGEPRFELTFTLDHERTLLVTARDLKTGTLVRENAPVHRLN